MPFYICQKSTEIILNVFGQINSAKFQQIRNLKKLLMAILFGDPLRTNPRAKRQIIMISYHGTASGYVKLIVYVLNSIIGPEMMAYISGKISCF